MGFFAQVMANMKTVVSAKRTEVLNTDGLSKVFETPECFETPVEDATARTQEYADWLNNCSDEEFSKCIVDLGPFDVVECTSEQQALFKSFNNF